MRARGIEAVDEARPVVVIQELVSVAQVLPDPVLELGIAARGALLLLLRHFFAREMKENEGK